MPSCSRAAAAADSRRTRGQRSPGRARHMLAFVRSMGRSHSNEEETKDARARASGASVPACGSLPAPSTTPPPRSSWRWGRKLDGRFFVLTSARAPFGKWTISTIWTAIWTMECSTVDSGVLSMSKTVEIVCNRFCGLRENTICFKRYRHLTYNRSFPDAGRRTVPSVLNE